MKSIFKLMYTGVLLVMIALAFVFPQSLAMAAVALWAWFGVIVCLLLLAAAAVGQCLWWKDGKSGLAGMTGRALGLEQKIAFSQQLRFVLTLALTTACLLYGGLEFTALSYLAALLGFRFLRSCVLLLDLRACPASSV